MRVVEHTHQVLSVDEREEKGRSWKRDKSVFEHLLWRPLRITSEGEENAKNESSG